MNLLSSAGLGLDIAGGWIIAIALLGSPATFAQRATTFIGGSPHTAAAAIESRADAELGIPILTSGFLGQLIAQSVNAEVSIWEGYLAAVVCALVPLAIWHWLWRPWRQRKLAIQVAHYRVENARKLPHRIEKPDLRTLASLGIGLGQPLHDSDETDEEYVARVFGVSDALKSSSAT